MNKHNLEGFYKYYSNATKEQAIEDMYMDNCKQAEEIERLQKILRTKTRLHRKRKAKVRKLREEITNKQKRLELLNSIIKEVREYIKNIPDDEFVESEHFTELLETLDKAGSENNES